VPATHVDLTCPDAVMALCDVAGGPRLVRECFGAAVAWIPFERDGLALARAVGAAVAASGVRLALVEKLGLLTWAGTARECHAATLAATDRATGFVAARSWGPSCGGRSLAPLSPRRRETALARVLAVLRRELATGARVLEPDVSSELLGFLCARDAPLLAQAGPVCPRQIPLMRRLPLWIDFDPAHEHPAELAERVMRGLSRYRARMRWEAAVCRKLGTAAADPDPRVVLVGGVGMVVAAPSGEAARRIAHAYRHVVAVMTSAAAIDRFVPLTTLESGAFLPDPGAVDPP
jgi:rhamnose utilization protein RhaD (predicted bifunctional aldolase and dehydrogenase)